jgi:hypothetical protein
MLVQTLEIPTEEALAAQVQRAADGDWKAAAWLLANGPATRAEWGSREPMRQMLQQQRRSFVAVIDAADLNPAQRTALIQGIAAIPVEPEDFNVFPDPDAADLLEPDA